MKFSYNKKSDALYIRFNKERIVESDQLTENVIVDYDKQGRIIGLEFLDASKKFAKDVYSKFTKGSLPVEMELLKA